MHRYFIEVAYKGTKYAGFQVQPAGDTIQGRLETALQTFYRKAFDLKCSSRTDSGVHARQNYFHTDTEALLSVQDIYHINALLPGDIMVKNIWVMAPSAHSRFDAIARRYHYYLHTKPDPFIPDQSWYYPYPVDKTLLQEAAVIVLQTADFTSFSKRNTQAKTMLCSLTTSEWLFNENQMVYTVQGNRFLRGMVKALVGTMLQVGRRKITINRFEEIIASHNCTLADFSTPPHGLFLEAVLFPANYFAT